MVGDRFDDRRAVDIEHDDREALGGAQAGNAIIGDDDAEEIGAWALGFGGCPPEFAGQTVEGRAGFNAGAQAEGQLLRRDIRVGGHHGEGEQGLLVDGGVRDGLNLRCSGHALKGYGQCDEQDQFKSGQEGH